jgi:TolA-binding protein
MRYHLANAKFMQGKYREAIAEYERYEKEFANGSDLEDVKYHLAVCRVFNGEWELALPRLKEYVEKYPNGFYVADARYRISVCNYASSEFEEVIQQTRKWLTDYANDPMRGEVSSLLGDALAATRQTEEAATAYMDATKHATTDEVLNYAVFEAGKMLQKLGRWEEVARHYGDFVNQHPAHYGVVAANYWICKAKSRTGDNEGAKQFTIDILRQFVNDPKKESVEQLFTQLAELCKKRPAPPKPAPGSSPAAEPIAATVPTPESGTPVVEATTPTTDGPGPVAAAAPALPPHDPQAEMEKWTSQLSSMLNNTGRARVAFGNAEMLKLLRQPDKAHQAIVEIALAYKPEELSSVLLGLVGDVFLERADFDRARACYEKLIQDHPKSDVVDYGYVGMGEVLYRIKQYDKALQYFADAAERFGAQKMRDAIMGRGKTLLELAVNKPELYEDAKKMYEQVAGVREWRGETTAESLYMLGQIEERRGRLPEAIAYYQRVFVTQQKWVSWVARSYLRAADCFDKLNRRKEAIAHLQEMGRRDKLRGLPEMAEAQKRLESWGL